MNDREIKEIKDLTFQIQNRGFSLAEHDHNYEASLALTDKALQIWIAIHDTVNEANNRKFRRLTLGYLKRFPEAKREIYTAIALFKSLGKRYGIAVSQFDLSKVFDIEGLSDSAFYYADSALEYWIAAGDTSRIVINVNHKIHLLYNAKEFNRAAQLQKESGALFLKKNIYWQDYLDYYYLSYLIYDKTNDHILAARYKDLYDQKVKSLKENNIAAKSAY